VKTRQYDKTLNLFKQGINPDKFTFFPVLHACASLGTLEETRLTLVSWMQRYVLLALLICTKDAGAWRMLGVFNEMVSCAIVSCTSDNVENKIC
jgi:hypothetical protein